MWLTVWKAGAVVMLISGTEGEGLTENICTQMQQAIIADAEGIMQYGDAVTCESIQPELGSSKND